MQGIAMTANRDLLSVTAFFSVMLHAIVILGISFKLPDITSIENTDNTLDVVLINAANNEVPIDSDTVSTNNNAGGGNDDREASSPIPYEAVDASDIDSIKKVATQQETNLVSPDRLITANSSSDISIQKETPVEDKLENQQEAVGPDKFTTKSERQLERERLIAKLAQSFEDYQKRPNKEFLSPNTSQHEAAQYLDDWRKRIEVTGNANYPIQARAEKLSGTLILTVEINRNGTIANIQIINPSPHKLLNDAAIRFVRNSAPFSSFPDQIDKETDILVITRAFHFLKNNQLTSSNVSRPES